MCSIHMLICRNPYFIGINSAIYREYFGKVLLISRNPYFIGINSAMVKCQVELMVVKSRNPYFIGINSAMDLFIQFSDMEELSQSLFYWN